MNYPNRIWNVINGRKKKLGLNTERIRYCLRIFYPLHHIIINPIYTNDMDDGQNTVLNNKLECASQVQTAHPTRTK